MKEYELRILRLNNEGFGVGKIDNKIVFVPNALKDELVKVKIVKIHKNYLEAEVVKIIEKSYKRTIPTCKYYYKCGGCNIMHMENQNEFKKEKVKNIFEKMCKEKIKLDFISLNDFYYRNKITLKVNKNKLGFYKYKTNEIVDVNECLIADKKINEIILKLRKFINQNDIDTTEIIIRNINNNIMINFDKMNLIDLFIEKFKFVNSIYVNYKLVYKEKELIENLCNLKFKVSIKSFFQVNKIVAEKIYDKVISYVEENDLTLDLYSGTGTISLLLSKVAKEVVGIESVVDAVKDANYNKKLNNINNVKFICSKVEDELNFLKKLKPSTIVVDPPRSGINKKVIEVIKKINPLKIIYVSCNPITLSRDYNLLKDKYYLKEITGYDMFPNTYHVECVCVLKLRKAL